MKPGNEIYVILITYSTATSLNRKYSMRGHVERQIQQEVKPSAVFVSRHSSSADFLYK